MTRSQRSTEQGTQALSSRWGKNRAYSSHLLEKKTRPADILESKSSESQDQYISIVPAPKQSPRFSFISQFMLLLVLSPLALAWVCVVEKHGTEDGLELLTLLPPPPKCWDYRQDTTMTGSCSPHPPHPISLLQTFPVPCGSHQVYHNVSWYTWTLFYVIKSIMFAFVTK